MGDLGYALSCRDLGRSAHVRGSLWSEVGRIWQTAACGQSCLHNSGRAFSQIVIGKRLTKVLRGEGMHGRSRAHATLAKPQVASFVDVFYGYGSLKAGTLRVFPC